MMPAFITSKNSPKVTTVIGKVKITKIGLTNTLSNPITMATTIAEVKPSTATPGNNLANKTTAMAVNNTRTIKFINLIFCWIKGKKPSVTKLKIS